MIVSPQPSDMNNREILANNTRGARGGRRRKGERETLPVNFGSLIKESTG